MTNHQHNANVRTSIDDYKNKYLAGNKTCDTVPIKISARASSSRMNTQ